MKHMHAIPKRLCTTILAPNLIGVVTVNNQLITLTNFRCYYNQIILTVWIQFTQHYLVPNYLCYSPLIVSTNSYIQHHAYSALYIQLISHNETKLNYYTILEIDTVFTVASQNTIQITLQ